MKHPDLREAQKECHGPSHAQHAIGAGGGASDGKGAENGQKPE